MYFIKFYFNYNNIDYIYIIYIVLALYILHMYILYIYILALYMYIVNNIIFLFHFFSYILLVKCSPGTYILPKCFYKK